MPRQFRVRKYNPIFKYMPGDLYEDISKDYLDTFDRYEWLGNPFLEDLAQPIAGILNLAFGVILFPIAIGMSIYEKSFDPILSLICRIVRGATQLITTALLPFKIITRLVLMKCQEKVSVETMLSTRYREGMESTVTLMRETLTLLEIEHDEYLKVLPKAGRCDLLFISSPFDEEKIGELPIQSEAAYVRVHIWDGQIWNSQVIDMLYYVNKVKGECTRIIVNSEKLSAFDAIAKARKQSVTLRKEQLKTITLITGHTHLPETEESKDVVVSTQRQSSESSDLYVLVQLQNRYTEHGKKCYVHDGTGFYYPFVVSSIPAPMSDNEIGGYIRGLVSRYRYLMYRRHPSSLDDPDDFIREGDSVADYFYNGDYDGDYTNKNPLTVSKYNIRHAQAFLDHFYPRISLEELSEMTRLPTVVSGIIAEYSPELFKSNFIATDIKYKKNKINDFCPYYPTGKMSM